MPDHYNDAMKEMRTRLPTSDAKQNAMMGLAEEGMKMATERGTTMTPEEELILDSLLKRGLTMDTALDIMAANKVDSMNKLQELSAMTGAAVQPQEFGGLPQTAQQPMMPPAPMMQQGGQGMTQQDMATYLANRTGQMKGAMGNMLGALSTQGMGAGGGAGKMMPTTTPNMMRR